MTVEPPSSEVPAPAHDAPPPGAATPFAQPPIPDRPAGAADAASAVQLPWYRWVGESLRAALFMAPRTGAATPSAAQLFVLMALAWGLMLWGEWWVTPGPVEFNLRAWLGQQWFSLALLAAAWWAMLPVRGKAQAAVPSPAQGGLPAWLLLSSWAMMPWVMPTFLLPGGAEAGGAAASGADAVPGLADITWHEWAVGAVAMLALVGAFAVLLRLTARFASSRARSFVFGLCLLVCTGIQFAIGIDPVWQPPADVAAAGDGNADDAGAADAPPAGMVLSQSVFEGQQLMMEAYAQDLTPERPGVVDVYGLVFAPYAGEEVFRRESTMVSDLLQERFDADGRVLHLLNHAQTADTHLWATPENLRSAVDALANTMDREQDVLVVYMTSHGARNHELAAAHPPLQVDPMTPELLRHMLDDAGIRHRVVAISACYSGGWIDTLATPSTLVMTAADATHTSYGCGMRSELTFFGRAVFDEQLRSTYSFTEAFRNAVPLIAQREVEAGKTDGFSNPQMRVGAEIEPVLDALAQRLQREAAAPSPLPRSAGNGLVAQIPMAQPAVQLR